MCRVIQQIPTEGGTSIYIVGFNVKTDEISFRTSYDPKYLQREKGILNAATNMVHINLYNFHKSYLQKFIKKNKN